MTLGVARGRAGRVWLRMIAGYSRKPDANLRLA